VQVRAIRLDDLAREEGIRPDVLKIDVEGAELWVLQGAREILREARPLILLELHAFAWPLFDTDAGALRRLLEEARYEILDIEPPHRPLEIFPDYGHALVRPL
jgi:hypothetical protein